MRQISFSHLYKSLLGSVMLAVLAVGCTNEDFNSPSTDEKDAVILSAGAALSADTGSKTRAANDTWDADDLIGVTMLNTSGDVVAPYTNRQYKSVAAGSGSVAFNPQPESQTMYYPINGSDVTFKAYYPYTGVVDLTRYPLDVSRQSTIADLDLMTAVHTNADGSAVNSKDNKEAHLVFHHRLTLVEVNLLIESGSSIDLEESKLVIKGMKTTGNYNLMNNSLTTDAGSVQDINIPLSPSFAGRAILLPREAAPGITFEVITADGGVYTAAMDQDLNLNGGSRYTFNLTLKTTPTLITASIEPWTDGPTKAYDIVNIITGTGTNAGFDDGASLALYTRDAGATHYTSGGTFNFDGTRWTRSGGPLYWESFTGPTVDFKATSTFAAALNSTQVPDYLLAETAGIDLYNGIHLNMEHVGAKATVKLSSSDGTYNAAALDGATVILPGYRNAYDFNATTVTYTTAAATGNITPEKQGTATINRDRVAILPPQTIAANATLVRVVINGHTYNVVDTDDAFDYEAGKQHEIRLNIRKSGVEMTVSLKDWDVGHNYEMEVQIGTPIGTSTNENIENGDQLYLFTAPTLGGTRSEVRGHFTYNTGTDNWSYSDAAAPLFWEELPNTGFIYAHMQRPAVNPASGYNQSPDYIVATPVENQGGTSTQTGTRIDFEMEHAVSQVKVFLRPSDTYTTAQLQTADIYLPGYTLHGSLDKGVYIPNTNTGDIRLDKPNNTEVSTNSYLQKQTIPAGQTVARVVIDSPAGTPRTYNVTYNNPVEYNAGEITHLFITITGSEVLVSVKVSDWDDQSPVELIYAFDQTDPTVEDFVDGDVIRFYDLGNGTTVTDRMNYVVGMVGSTLVLNPQGGTPWFRDDFATGDRIVAVFPAPDIVPDVTTGNTFNWNMTGKSDPAERNNDILVATDGIIADRNANVDLDFKHVLSKVTVNIIRGEGFTDSEISTGVSGVQLVDFMQNGTVNISNGSVPVASLSGAAPFAPTPITPANTNVNDGGDNAVLSYQALVLPQTKAANNTLVKITLNDIEYEAKYSTAFPFKPGEHHVLNITLEKTGLKLSATIAPWVEGDSGNITIK